MLMNLNSLTPLNSLDTPAPSATVSQVAHAMGDVISQSLDPTRLIFGLSLVNLVMIILGLLLIAAGIFGFDKTREVITTAAAAAA